MITPVMIVPPVSDLVDLRLVKENLRIDGVHLDFFLKQLITAAIAKLDGWSGYLGRCVSAQTWRSQFATLTDQRLPFPDVRSAVVTYLDADGASQTLSTSAYSVVNDSLGACIKFDAFYALPMVFAKDDAVTVDCVYGPDALDETIKVAVLMMVATWYDAGDGSEDMPPAVKSLLALRRVVRL